MTPLSDETVLALASDIRGLAKVLTTLEMRLASIEEQLGNPRRGWVFQPDRFYALEEIERRSGYIPNTIPSGYIPNTTRGGVAVVDIRGDYTQYDFEAMGDGRYRLAAVDGMRIAQP